MENCLLGAIDSLPIAKILGYSTTAFIHISKIKAGKFYQINPWGNDEHPSELGWVEIHYYACEINEDPTPQETVYPG